MCFSAVVATDFWRRVWAAKARQCQGFCSPFPHKAHDNASVHHELLDFLPFYSLLSRFTNGNHWRVNWAIGDVVANSLRGKKCKQGTAFLNISYLSHTLIILIFMLVLWDLNCSPHRILPLNSLKVSSGSSVLAAFGAEVVDPQQVLQDSWQENRAHRYRICYNFFFPLLPSTSIFLQAAFFEGKIYFSGKLLICCKHHGQERSLCHFGSPITRPLLWPSESPALIYGN